MKWMNDTYKTVSLLLDSLLLLLLLLVFFSLLLLRVLLCALSVCCFLFIFNLHELTNIPHAVFYYDQHVPITFWCSLHFPVIRFSLLFFNVFYACDQFCFWLLFRARGFKLFNCRFWLSWNVRDCLRHFQWFYSAKAEKCERIEEIQSKKKAKKREKVK